MPKPKRSKVEEALLGDALESSITASEFINLFPMLVKERLGETKQAYYHLFDVFTEAMDEIPYFDEVFAYHQENGLYTRLLSKDNTQQMEQLDPIKKALAGQLIVKILSSCFEQYQKMTVPKSIRRTWDWYETSSDDDDDDDEGDESDDGFGVSENQNNKNSKKKQVKRKTKSKKKGGKKRGNGKKSKKQNDDVELDSSSATAEATATTKNTTSEEKAENEPTKPTKKAVTKKTPTAKKPSSNKANKTCNEAQTEDGATKKKHDSVSWRPNLNNLNFLEETKTPKFEKIGENDKETIVKFKGEIYHLPKNATQEQLQYGHGENSRHLERILKAMKGVLDAVVYLLNVDPEGARNAMYTNLSNMFGELAAPLSPPEHSTEKMHNIVDLVTQLTDPKNDYSVYKRAQKDCPELMRVARARLSRAQDKNIVDVWRLFLDDEDGDEHWKVPLGGVYTDEVEEDDYDELFPKCDCHGPCPCCCSGCYDYHHLGKPLNTELLYGEDMHEKEPHPADVRPRLRGVLKKTKGLIMPATDENGRPKIEQIEDDDEKLEKYKHNRPVEDLLENENGWKEICSHCCCQCNLKHYNEVTMPDVKDYEGFAIKFMEELLKNTPSSQKYCFKAAEILAQSDSDLLLKQKLIEVGMPKLLELLKVMKVNTQLYIIHLIFKLTMSMVVARKYLFRDPEFFPTIARLLTVIDPCKNRDPNQLRIDSSHILYVTLMGCGREYFVQVARTKAFEYLIDQLQLVPQNDKDAQSAEDAFGCLMLFTDEWDLFIKKFQKTPMNKLVDRWRRYALEYADYLPNFIWSLEMFKKRLLCIYEAHRRGKPSFRLEKTFNPERLQEHCLIGCSNPACYKINFASFGDSRYKKCSRCQLAYYCTKECQLVHWKKHKKYCVKLIIETPSNDTTKKGGKKDQKKLPIEDIDDDYTPIKREKTILDKIDDFELSHGKFNNNKQPKEHEEDVKTFDSLGDIFRSLYGK